MQTLERANRHVADLHWVAFLLTGDRARSLDLTLEAVAAPDPGNSFFSTWMLAWSRRVFLSKALALVRDELAESARRTASRRVGRAAVAPRNWTLDSGASKLQMESALLAIDSFPRCALVLSIFEGVALPDVATLLNSDPDLVRKARSIGLQELVRNLAGTRNRATRVTTRYAMTGEVQHA
jgi:DNA-directed RNA polymerase specialized sigma24 family protein